MKPISGIVVSTKMNKTVTVEVKRQTAHPLYHKRVWTRKKYHVHDEAGVKVGDQVKIGETRPLSKTKRWRIIEVVDSKKKTGGKVGNKKIKKTAEARNEPKSGKTKRETKREKK